MTRPSRILPLLAAVAALAAAAPALAADAPGTTLSGPSGTTADATPTFSFTSTEPEATFECRLDAGAWASCSSPHTVEVADGEHEFAVRAIDAAGNVDPTPATRAFTVDRSGIDTTITGGPSGLTNDPTPSFSFGTTTTGATYECRLDGPGSPIPTWAACSQPLTLPSLRAGDHALLVRALIPDGRPDPTPARRAFSVDADAPETTLAEGPAEGADSPSRTPAFGYASEPGARFECRLDNKVKNGVDLVAWADCPAAGFTPAKPLDGGAHVFEVRATDAAGNADPTPVRRAFRVVACERTVRFGLVEATGACLLDVGTDDAPRWESDGDVTLNGLPVPAPGPAKVVLQAPAAGSSGGGSLSVTDLSLRVAGVELHRGALKVDLPAGGAGEEKTAMTFPLGGQGEKLFGLELGGQAILRLGRRAGSDDRYAVLGLKVALPSVFKAGPSGGTGGVTGDVAIRMSPREGVQLDGLKIAVGNAYVGGLGVKSLCLSYLRANASAVAACEAPRIGPGTPAPFLQCKSDSTVDRWDGALSIILPTASSTELGLWGGLAGGRLSHAGAYVDKLGTLVPLAPGVFLERVALGVCLEPPPFQVKGEAAIAFGPDFKGKRAAVVSGSMHYTDSFQGSPWVIEAGGSLVLFDYPLAEAWLKYQSSGLVDFGFRAGFDFGPASLEGKVAGWAETRRGGRFNVRGSLAVCVDDVACAQAEGVISTIGAAGCITVTLANVPVPYWKGPWPTDWAIKHVPVEVTGGAGHAFATRQTNVMVGSCDVGPWEAQATARAAQAGPSTAFVVDAGQPATVVGISGAGGAPRVALVGPDGRRIEAPAHGGGAFVEGSHLLAEDAERGETTVMVAGPAAGTWRVEALPGSPAITGVRQAATRPAPMVSAHVMGKGHRRHLYYAHKPVAGQKLTLVERGARTQQTLGVARGERCRAAAARRAGLRCGRITFRPGLGGAGERRIEVLVEEGGVPRPDVLAGTYVAPADARPGAPRKLRLVRTAKAMRLSWATAPDAHRVNVIVRTRDGRRLLFIRSPRQRTLTVPANTTRVAARGMRMDGTEGRPATAVAPKTRKPKTTRRTR